MRRPNWLRVAIRAFRALRRAIARRRARRATAAAVRTDFVPVDFEEDGIELFDQEYEVVVEDFVAPETVLMGVGVDGAPGDRPQRAEADASIRRESPEVVDVDFKVRITIRR